MNVELIATGDELLTGAIADTNSATAAELVRTRGGAVRRVTVVGDDPADMLRVLREACERAEVIVCSGGLGPTEDDRTAATVAELAGVELELNETALAQVEKTFQKIGRPMTPNNRKQAMLPAGCVVLDNPVGSAPGFHVTVNGTALFFLPGVPHEYRKMLEEHVLPRIDDQTEVHATRVIKMFGQGESHFASMLDGAVIPNTVAIGWRPSFPEVHLRLYGTADDDATLAEAMNAAETAIRERLDKYIFGVDKQTFSGVIGELLRERKLTVAVAESCTGGGLGAMITEVSGASDYFERGFLTYSNAAKQALLGVPADILEQHGAVSEECALAMAEGTRAAAATDIALSITGIAGPTGGTPEKPVGTVYVAIATESGSHARHLQLWGGRARIRTVSAYAALEMVRRHLAA